jgi:hypothetical protein
MKPRPRGVFPGEGNTKRGSASSHRVTPACLVRILRMLEPLKLGLEEEPSWRTPDPS